MVWDPFHTSPEEHLATIGLVPLFLALSGIRRGWRGDAAVRALAIVALVTTLLSLGPYIPGFRALIHLPGFSFFRAPARWGLASALALALLAGRGFDAWPAWPRPGRALTRFALMAAVAIVAVVLLFELALVAAKPGADPRLVRGFDRVLKTLPWSDDPGEPGFAALVAEAYRPQTDPRVATALARQKIRPASGPSPSWKAERFAIYRQELAGTTAVLLALLVVAATLTGRPRAFALALVLLTFLDAAWLSRQRPFDLGPIRPLVQQSPVLARLARESRGTLSLDPARNLFQVAGIAPAWSYRTLDLPSPLALLGRAERGGSVEAMHASGVGVRVLGPFDRSDPAARPPDAWVDPARTTTVRDSALAGWLYGVDLAQKVQAEDFTLLRSREEPTRAWLVRRGSMATDDPQGASLVDLLRGAAPLPWRPFAPEQFEVNFPESTTSGLVVIARTFDPEWRASWISPAGDRPAEVLRAPGGWMAVALPTEPGPSTLRLRYDGRAARIGLIVSAVAWAIGIVGYLRSGKRPGPDLGETA